MCALSGYVVHYVVHNVRSLHNLGYVADFVHNVRAYVARRPAYVGACT